MAQELDDTTFKKITQAYKAGHVLRSMILERRWRTMIYDILFT